MLVTLFLSLQATSLGLQLYSLYKQIRHDMDAFDVFAGYGIWGGIITVLLGLPLISGWV